MCFVPIHLAENYYYGILFSMGVMLSGLSEETVVPKLPSS